MLQLITDPRAEILTLYLHRLLVSGSKDTTLKVWDVASGKLKENLPGHQDEVFGKLISEHFLPNRVMLTPNVLSRRLESRRREGGERRKR